VAMEHTTKEGAPRILRKCTLPLTGVGVVNTIITELAVFRVDEDGLHLEELQPGAIIDDVLSRTGATVHVKAGLRA
jgi:acyl CoA:acetate/3-ketoacid CoA transferase beta subunit